MLNQKVQAVDVKTWAGARIIIEFKIHMANTYNENMPLDTHEFIYIIYNLYT